MLHVINILICIQTTPICGLPKWWLVIFKGNWQLPQNGFEKSANCCKFSLICLASTSEDFLNNYYKEVKNEVILMNLTYCHMIKTSHSWIRMKGVYCTNSDRGDCIFFLNKSLSWSIGDTTLSLQLQTIQITKSYKQVNLWTKSLPKKLELTVNRIYRKNFMCWNSYKFSNQCRTVQHQRLKGGRKKCMCVCVWGGTTDSAHLVQIHK